MRQRKIYPHLLALDLADDHQVDLTQSKTAYETILVWMRGLDHDDPRVSVEFETRHRLFSDLLEAPEHEERLERVRRDRLYQQWGLCRLLLDMSAQVRSGSAAYSLDLAELADAAAQGLDRDLYGVRWVADLRALAAANLGAARRALGQVETAFEELRRAWMLLAKGTGRPHVAASIAQLEALLLRGLAQPEAALPLVEIGLRTQRFTFRDHPTT